MNLIEMTLNLLYILGNDIFNKYNHQTWSDVSYLQIVQNPIRSIIFGFTVWYAMLVSKLITILWYVMLLVKKI